MGWNDHVDHVQMQCKQCGMVDVWEFWDDTAKARYGGDLGKKLGHDVAENGRCPYCGCTEGFEVDE